jgi:hypothetical protein
MQTLIHGIEHAERITGLPRNALLATLILVVGALCALGARWLTARFVREFGRLVSGNGRNDDEVSAAMQRHRIDVLFGRGAFWLVVLFTVLIATDQLGLQLNAMWTRAIASYLPRLLMGVVIIFIGVMAGSLGRGALVRALPANDHIDPERLGSVVQMLVVAVSLLLAVQQLGIDVGFLTTVLTIALVGFFAASALAFGFGGRATVANILAGHYVRELYEVGNTVRIAGLEGRIVRMTPTAVIVSNHEGETAVPTHLFVETLSTRVATRGQL